PSSLPDALPICPCAHMRSTTPSLATPARDISVSRLHAAGSAHFERPALAGRIEFALIEAVDPRCAGPAAQPFEHGLDVGLGAFELGLDPPVGQVAHPARDPVIGGHRAGAHPEAHALHHPGDQHVYASHPAIVSRAEAVCTT